MCVTSSAGEPLPVTTNVGVGQCAGAAAAGAELLQHNEDTHIPRKTLVPASIAAAAEGGDDAASFDLLFASGSGDYTASEDMQMVMQEFVADPEGRSVALKHLREEA